MSEFSLLNYLNIKVPNEPSTPISQKKESYKILSPAIKPEDRGSSHSTPIARKTPERSLEHTTPSDAGNTSPRTGTAKPASPYYRTTYTQAYAGTATSGPSAEAPEEDAPLTPSSRSSVASGSSISSTISICEDPECDECLNKKGQNVKKLLAQHEKDLERSEFQSERKRIEDEIAQEQIQEAEKKERIKRDVAADKERLRAERADQRAQKQREDEEEVAMRKELSKVDQTALEAQKARNREYVGDLQQQIEDDRARRIAQDEEIRAAAPGAPLSFGADEEARQAARAASQKEVLATLQRQVADKRAEGKAEKKAEDEEVRRGYAADEAAYQAKTSAEEEKKRLSKEDILNSNRDAISEKKAREQDAQETERAWTVAQREQLRRDAEEEKRKNDENKRAELEALHRQLSDQVQRRREALKQAREEDKAYLPREATSKKNQYIHCVDCDQDKTPNHFSNYVITSSGKVYKKSKAIPKGSPLHKYVTGRAEAQPMDLSHNYS